MDRQIVYPGAIPLDTDILNVQKNGFLGVGKVAEALLGQAAYVNGLTVAPTAPASLQVSVGAGEIYALAQIDPTAYGSLAADTTHFVMKQGVLYDATLLSAITPPATPGQSQNYLVQASFTEVDGGSTVLPYYNASNPSQPYSGPNNTGASQNTKRSGTITLQLKAGTAATTGTQTTPTPDSGFVGLAVITVANGATSITSGNISTYFDAPLVPQAGAAFKVHNAYYSRSVAGNSDVTLTAREAAYPIINLTGALTGNINLILPAASGKWIISNNTSGAFTLTAKTPAGTGITITQGTSATVYSDGVNVYAPTPSGLSAYAQLGVTQTFTKAQRGQVVALPATTGTVSPDFSSSNNFSSQVTGNITLGNAYTNAAAGQSGVIRVQQNGSTLYNWSFGSNWKYVGGSTAIPGQTQTLGAYDEIVYYIHSATEISFAVRSNVG